MTEAARVQSLAAYGLTLRGSCLLEPEDGFGDSGHVSLIGPVDGDFWPIFASSPEYADGAPNPMDRWSKRVLGDVAQAAGARAVFPSDGPPFPPFIRWALRSGRTFASPVGLMVHSDTGLFLSFRGALLSDTPILPDLPALAAPCDTCETQPCRTACPAGALPTNRGYNVAGCKAHLRSDDGTDCRLGGCLVRRACPASQNARRSAEQSAFHLKAFLGD